MRQIAGGQSVDRYQPSGMTGSLREQHFVDMLVVVSAV